MRIKNLILILLFAGLVGLGWQYSALSLLSRLPAADARAQEEGGETPISQGNVIRDLPCFKCHIYSQFIREPSKGFFSHALHIQFDYHCNQCHSFRGHRQMVINTSVCTFCHGEVPQLGKME